MGDISSGIAYICGSFCCLRNTGVDADGSGFAASGPKADPREREIDALFMARDYKKDAAGRFIRQPPPTRAMYPRTQSDETREVKKSCLEVPHMAQLNSTSTGGTTLSQTKEPLDSIALESLPPLG
ncbi:hypothetical protein HYPSUDRAFT_34988 [Hypholoma sublateritium FD-334 SS-4]|uniref:Uncharacterized protein n=1 Tax=Hypholoma sublateritium (strain FD-334 SS-4) TaxID=945553 RepID=A0A0D2PAA9_HYPSF|nr:hypothetical protein HYPSUDRAFT_34988 [Hypholoma sublateritium FD-334 SS-4]